MDRKWVRDLQDNHQELINMTTILPSERGPWDVIGKAIGQNVSQNLPGAVQQGYQRQLGMNALQQAEQEIAQAGGDPYKIALAFAKVGAQNPALERSLGPLMQTAMNSAAVNRAFPGSTGQQVNGQGPVQAAQNAINMGKGPQSPQVPPEVPQETVAPSQVQPSTFATPSPFNIMTANDIDAESKRYANALRDPNAYQSRYDQLIKQNELATRQREGLEDFALKSNVSPKDLPLFMKVGSKFDPRNPSEWALKTRREYDKVKSNFDKLETAFIPGVGSGLLGRDRSESLKRLTPTVQDLVKEGLEQETRSFLIDSYLTPTEVSEQIHPLTKKDEKSINSIPKGIFPFQKSISFEKGHPEIPQKSPFISYEEALEKAPQQIQTMQNILSDYFLNNVGPETSLLGLRDKIIKERDYDWRQFGPALRQAMQNGLTLEPFQSTEMTEMETQPPYDSLPDIFRELSRIPAYLRGAK